VWTAGAESSSSMMSRALPAGQEISLAYAHLSLVFDKARRAYSLTCDDEDGEAVRLILKPSELERIVREFLAARAWSSSVGGVVKGS